MYFGYFFLNVCLHYFKEKKQSISSTWSTYNITPYLHQVTSRAWTNCSFALIELEVIALNAGLTG